MENGASKDTDRQLDFHPGMDMRWEITRGTEDSSGEAFESTNWLDVCKDGEWMPVCQSESRAS